MTNMQLIISDRSESGVHDHLCSDGTVTTVREVGNLGPMDSLGILRGVRLSPVAMPFAYFVLYDQHVRCERIP